MTRLPWAVLLCPFAACLGAVGDVPPVDGPLPVEQPPGTPRCPPPPDEPTSVGTHFPRPVPLLTGPCAPRGVPQTGSFELPETPEKKPELAVDRFGVNLDPKNPGANPPADKLRDVGARWARFEFKQPSCDASTPLISDFDPVVQQLRAGGVKVLLIIDYASVKGTPFSSDDPARWATFGDDFAACAKKIVTHFASPPFAPDAVAAYEIWNEPDHGGGSHPASYDPYVPPVAYAHLFAKTVPGMRQAFAAAAPGATPPTVVTGGLDWGAGSGWLDAMLAELAHFPADAQPDAIGVHSYGERPDPDWPTPTWGFANLADSLDRYHAIGQRPLWITEFGIEDTSIQAELITRLFARVRTPRFEKVVAHAIVYAWSDAQGDANHRWGLVDQNDQKKASYCHFRASAYGISCDAPVPAGAF